MKGLLRGLSLLGLAGICSLSGAERQAWPAGENASGAAGKRVAQWYRPRTGGWDQMRWAAAEDPSQPSTLAQGPGGRTTDSAKPTRVAQRAAGQASGWPAELEPAGSAMPLPDSLELPVAAALQVLQQPADDPVFVSHRPGTVTQFLLPARYGATALLAHNSSSGELFLGLGVADVASLSYPDGKRVDYRVEQIRRFQTLQPNDPRSDFLDLDRDQRLLTVAEVFGEIYTRPGSLVLQTCIAAEGEPSWGIQFTIAAPFP